MTDTALREMRSDLRVLIEAASTGHTVCACESLKHCVRCGQPLPCPALAAAARVGHAAGIAGLS